VRGVPHHQLPVLPVSACKEQSSTKSGGLLVDRWTVDRGATRERRANPNHRATYSQGLEFQQTGPDWGPIGSGVTTQPLRRRGSSSLQLAASPYGARARSGTPL
jgi:hypothetical protein